MDKIEFFATIQGAGWLKVDSDGEATIKLKVSASQLREVLKLSDRAEQLIKVTITEAMQ